MRKLLDAGFYKLRKDTIFWLFIFLTIGIVGLTVLKYQYRFAGADIITLDRAINDFIMYIGIFIAIFVSIFARKRILRWNH